MNMLSTYDSKKTKNVPITNWTLGIGQVVEKRTLILPRILKSFALIVLHIVS